MNENFSALHQELSNHLRNVQGLYLPFLLPRVIILQKWGIRIEILFLGVITWIFTVLYNWLIDFLCTNLRKYTDSNSFVSGKNLLAVNP